MQQHTLRDGITFEGVGLHTGVEARVDITPSAAGGGLRFRLDGGAVEFPAHAEYVVDTRRCTVVGTPERRVSTVEHVLSALVAGGVDNAWIDVEGPEIPILDGSSATFAAAISAAGLQVQSAARPRFTVDRPHAFREGEATLVVLPADDFRITFAVEFAPPVGAQLIDMTIEADSYAREIAPARTFGYVHEVEALLAAGLARGGSLDNALVFAPDGPLTPLRWPNEVVRHKVLDLIGDFALLGAWPQFHVVAIKSGHRLHAEAVRALRQAYAAPGEPVR